MMTVKSVAPSPSSLPSNGSRAPLFPTTIAGAALPSRKGCPAETLP